MPTDRQNTAMNTGFALNLIAEGNETPCGFPKGNICRGCNALQILDRIYGITSEGHYIRLGWLKRFKIWLNMKRRKKNEKV